MKYLKHISENLNIDATKYGDTDIDTEDIDIINAKKKWDTIAYLYEFFKKEIYKNLGDINIEGISLYINSNNGLVAAINANISSEDYNKYVGGYIESLNDGKTLSDYYLTFQMSFLEDSYKKDGYMNKINYQINHYKEIKKFIEYLENKFYHIIYGGHWVNFKYNMDDYVNMMANVYRKVNN